MKYSRTRLSKEEILKIPLWADEGRTVEQIAKVLKKHPRTVSYWTKRLRKDGHKVNFKKGKRAINLNE